MFGICKPDRGAASKPIVPPPQKIEPEHKPSASVTTPENNGGSSNGSNVCSKSNSSTFYNVTSRGLYFTSPETVETGDIYVCLGAGLLRDGNFHIQLDDPATLDPVNVFSVVSSPSGGGRVIIKGDLVIDGSIKRLDGGDPFTPLSTSSTSSTPQNPPIPLLHGENSDGEQRRSHASKKRHGYSRVNIGKTDTEINIRLPAEGKGTVSFNPLVANDTPQDVQINIEWDTIVESIPLVFTQFVCDDLSTKFRVLEVTDDGMKWLLYAEDSELCIMECKVFYKITS